MQVGNVKSNFKEVNKTDYSTFRLYAVHLSRALDNEKFDRLVHTLNVCDKMKEEKEKKTRLLNFLYHVALWDVEDAKELGFVEFLQKDLIEVKRLFDYMEKNNKEYFNTLMRNYNERKESRLC